MIIQRGRLRRADDQYTLVCSFTYRRTRAGAVLMTSSIGSIYPSECVHCVKRRGALSSPYTILLTSASVFGNTVFVIFTIYV